MTAWLRMPLRLALLGLLGFVVLATVITGAYYYVEPSLPDAEEIRNVNFRTPLRIYSRDGLLISQYGEEKRIPAQTLDEIPELLRNAVIAAEDDQFYQHSGIDLFSTLRAVFNYGVQRITGSDETPPGGSTITQQVPRTMELISREASVGRKVAEIFLAFRIEREFTKDEILRLYLNTYFFGQRSYGVVAAARTYFNKALSDLTLSEIAIIAGIPTAPSVNNPYNGPENARNRRAYVLRRMEELGFIDAAARQAALAEPIVSQTYGVELELEAGYVADMVIDWCMSRFGDRACREDGLVIYTTLDGRAQQAANQAQRAVLEAYDRKHGYRGPIGHFDLASLGLAGADTADSDTDADTDADTGADTAAGAGDADARAGSFAAADIEGIEFDADPGEVLSTLLGDFPDRFGAEAGVVLAVDELGADVYLRSAGASVRVALDSVGWARPFINDERAGQAPASVGDVLSPGDVARFRPTGDGLLELVQIPEAGNLNGSIDNYVEGALVSLDPMDGAIVALVGGYGHEHSPFNRAATGKRQPGSAFKPFFYSAALSSRYTLSTLVNDTKDCYYDATLERQHCVENYSDNYAGLIRLRRVFFESKNAPADRVIRDIGASYVANYVQRFGFDPSVDETNASLALGSLAVTPLELANAYAILANGGYAVGIADPGDGGEVKPYFVQRAQDAVGSVLYDASLSVRMRCPEPDPQTPAAEERLIEWPGELYARRICAERVERAQIVFLITDVLKQVIREGTGSRARAPLNYRADIAGKTGTTNGPGDVWFAGFNADLVAVARVGFDEDARKLGANEQGGTTAIPAWIDYMKVMLDGQPEHALAQPTGIARRLINPETGLLAADCNTNTIWEYFLVENQPERESDAACLHLGSGAGAAGGAATGAGGSDAQDAGAEFDTGPGDLFE